VFPNPEALLRLAGAVLVEAHDEWQATDRRYLGETTMALLTSPPTDDKVATPGGLFTTVSARPEFTWIDQTRRRPHALRINLIRQCVSR
jgi:hypothetical protein